MQGSGSAQRHRELQMARMCRAETQQGLTASCESLLPDTQLVYRFPWWIHGGPWRVGSHSNISFGIILPTASNHRGLSHHSPDCAGKDCSVLHPSGFIPLDSSLCPFQPSCSSPNPLFLSPLLLPDSTFLEGTSTQAPKPRVL